MLYACHDETTQFEDAEDEKKKKKKKKRKKKEKEKEEEEEEEEEEENRSHIDPYPTARFVFVASTLLDGPKGTRPSVSQKSSVANTQTRARSKTDVLIGQWTRSLWSIFLVRG